MKIKIHALCTVKSAKPVVLLLFSHLGVGLVRTSRTDLRLLHWHSVAAYCAHTRFEVMQACALTHTH